MVSRRDSDSIFPLALGIHCYISCRWPSLSDTVPVTVTFLLHCLKVLLFSVRTPGAGAGDVGVIIVDSNGRRDTVEIVLENRGDSVFRCTYVPVLEGPHVVCVTFAGQQIPRSPFTVHISEGGLLTFTLCLKHYKLTFLTLSCILGTRQFLQWFKMKTTILS